MEIFLLQHVHEMPGGDEDTKLIGVYASRQLAEAARKRARQLPGFRESPEGFTIDRYELNKDHWAEGFVTV